MMMVRTSLVVVAALGVGLLGSFAVAQPAAERKPAAPPAASPARPAAPALEVPKPAASAKFLGGALTGSNYTVRPTARSDGIMRLFEVDTPYSAFQFDGVEFTRMRLRELEATAALEKMSQSDAWVKSFGRTAVAPLKFGVDFVVNPFDTVGRSVTGIHNMFDRPGPASPVSGQTATAWPTVCSVSAMHSGSSRSNWASIPTPISRRWRKGCGRWPVPWPAAS
jgi:hypothetical protein